VVTRHFDAKTKGKETLWWARCITHVEQTLSRTHGPL
jgi:hypothetical protein